MEDKETSRKNTFANRVHESEHAVAYDKQCLADDTAKNNDKRNFLSTFRDANKQVLNCTNNNYISTYTNMH